MEFSLLGPLRVTDPTGVRAIGSPKQRTILAALLLQSDRLVSTEQLTHLVWNGRPPASARPALHNLVMRLRGSFAQSPDLIHTQPTGYVLRLGAHGLDTLRFEELRTQGSRAAAEKDWERAAGVLADALGLWLGAPLEDVQCDDLHAAHVHFLEQARLDVTQDRIDADLHCGRHHAVITELQKVSAEHPSRERFTALLMLALYRAGRQADALAAYRDTRRRLGAELGIEPGSELRELQQRILAADPALAWTAVPAGPAATASATAPAGAAPAQLPADTPDFTGREAAVARLTELMTGGSAPGTVVISTIAGMGGIGKSALAVHVANLWREQFPDGQIYVELRGATEPRDPAEVLAEVLRALGVPASALPAGTQARSALYRSTLAGRRLLLVLDDASDSAQVRPLLPGAAGCGVLVSSRSRLSALSGATRFDLDVLSEREAWALLSAVVGAQRVAAEPEAAALILQRCAGLPLAVRIAGARLAARPHWPLRTLADRLSSARLLDELTIEDAAVRSSFQVSYEALLTSADAVEQDAARAFRLLGLWLGPDLGLVAAGELLGLAPARAEEALETLVDAHLLESPSPERYRFHDLLRAYAGELADDEEPPQERTLAVDRLVNWYLRTTAFAADQFNPDRTRPEDEGNGLSPCPSAIAFADRPTAMAWCRAERANLVAAVRFAAVNGLKVAAWQLPAIAYHFYTQVGYWSDLEAADTIGLAAARDLGDTGAHVRMLIGLSTAHWMHERPAEADAAAREACELVTGISDDALDFTTASHYATTLHGLNRLEEAAAWYEKALAGTASAAKPGLRAATLNNLALVCQRLERYEQAVEYYQEALDLARSAGSGFLEAAVLDGLGVTRHEFGDPEAAVELLDQAITLRRRLGDQTRVAASLEHLGDVHSAENRGDQAHDVWQEALALLPDTESPAALTLREKMAKVVEPPS